MSKNLPWFVLVPVGAMNQRVVEHRNLRHIAAARTSHANPPAIGEIADTLPIEGEFVDAIGTS